jgi:hypothetical protein
MNGGLRKFAFVFTFIATSVGGTWAAKGYIDREIKSHRHTEMVTREDIGKINDKLDDLRDRLARIEGRMEK